MGDNDGPKELLQAIQDLTRVTIALSGRFESKADSIRQLIELGIPPVRVAALLAIPSKQVHAELAKAKRRGAKQ
jgi:hypothetical protein